MQTPRGDHASRGACWRRAHIPTVLASALAIGASALAIGCGGSESPADGPTPATGAAPAPSAAKPIEQFKIGLSASEPVSSMDPSTDQTAHIVGQYFLERLTEVDADGVPQPALAERVTQPDPKTYVYHLRHGVRFWDGAELTADDVVYSMDYLSKPTSVSSFPWSTFKSAKAKDRYTVVVTLKQADASWPNKISHPMAPIFQKKFAEEHEGNLGKPGTLIMGTGPFEPKRFDPASGEVELTANPNWWGGRVGIEKLSLNFFTKETSLALAMRSGSIDAGVGASRAEAFQAAAGPDVQEVAFRSCSEPFLAMNVRKAPWSDVHVRRAVAYAMDHDALIKASGARAVTPGPNPTLIATPNLETVGSREQVEALLASIPQYEHSVEKAKAELAKSRYPDGVSADFTYYTWGPSGDVMQVLAAQLQEAGIEIKPRLVQYAAWIANEGQANVAERWPTLNYAGACSSPDPSGYAGYLGADSLQKGSYNFAAYGNDEFNGWWARGLATSDRAERFDLYSKMVTAMAEDVPFLPLFLGSDQLYLREGFSVAGAGKWLPTDWPLTITAEH